MEGTFDHPLFGRVRFRTPHEIWIRGDDIKFVSGFDVHEVTSVHIPQLNGVAGAPNGVVQFHKRGHAQLQMVFADLERLNLVGHIKKCGTFNQRLRKPTHGGLSKLPSNHAFGTAIDLNSDDPGHGASAAPFAPVFQALGFLWGAAFNDPMHFEVEEFIENPQSVAAHLAMHIG